MSKMITHRDSKQIVSREELRRVLRRDGERCYCAPQRGIEWDAGMCPQHRRDTTQTRYIPVLAEHIGSCCVCGGVACERDLLWTGRGDEVICRHCAA